MIFEHRSRFHRFAVLALAASAVATLILLIGSIVFSMLVQPQFKESGGKAWQSPVAHGKLLEIEQAAENPSEKIPAYASASPAARRQAFRSLSHLRTAFLAVEEANSLADYAKHAHELDAVFPVSLFVSTRDGRIQHRASATGQPVAFSEGNLVLPVISNSDANGNWQPDELAFLLDDEAKGKAFIASLKAEVLVMKADGVNIDFEQLSADERDNFSQWIKWLADSFHQDGLLVTVDVPLYDEAFDYELLGETADFVVLMAYDEHFAKGQPGSIAGQPWFDDGLEEMVQRIPPEKLIVALGAYGYDWNTATPAAPAALGFSEAMMLAADHHSELESKGEAMNTSFTYADEAKNKHVVWVLDAISAWNQLDALRQNKVRGVSFWKLGMEDPGLWDFLPTMGAAFDVERLKVASAAPDIAFTGEGELLNVRSLPKAGQRSLSFDGNRVDWCGYESLPSYYNVERSGHSAKKQLALTFDDGPDDSWTPRVLDVLRRHHVPGTFFVVGDQAQKFPQLVSREFAEGHVIGNHTFLHPNLKETSEARLSAELNSTQRVIESITGRGTRLFRAPFDTDTSPTEPAQLLPLHQVSQQGFVIAGGDIDSADYTTPGADVIVNNITKCLKPNGPNIIVLHDGGGDRSQTVEALDKLIPSLQQQGYTFSTVADLMGATRDEVMPHTTSSEGVIVAGSTAIGWLRTGGWKFIQVLFFATTGISILRIVFLGILVARGRRNAQAAKKAISTARAGGRRGIRSPLASGGRFTPPITVLVPAYNEAKVIRRTLDGVLQADYPNLNILVVDDGSKDGTADIVRAYARQHPQVKLLAKPNGGKWSALNEGFRATASALIVTIDADTIVPPHTIRELIAPFADPSVDAVCGNVQVGNVHNILTAFQDVEYVTTQNYDRRAFEALNCISVVPGATGAWRRSTVLRVGGYSDMTLTEDADLTLTMLANGARIVYAPEARSVTEAPDTVADLYKQRIRWSFGTFQCLWKHRRNLFKGTLGWVAMPNLFCFQVLYPLLSPLGDLMFLLALGRGDFSVVFVGYVTFLLMDFVSSVVAFKLDGRRPRGLWVLFFQRFYYRQFMYVVAIKSMLQALRGGRRGWNKLERKASVPAQPSAKATSSELRKTAMLELLP
jgi:peptidoglycan-N-acetylglucosamine deacetylase